MRNKDFEPDPFQWLDDKNSAIEEYYHLKQMLCLTDAERFVLKYRKPYPKEFDYIYQLWQVKEEYKMTISDIALKFNIPRKTMARIFNHLEIPERNLKYKILKYLEVMNEQ